MRVSCRGPSGHRPATEAPRPLELQHGGMIAITPPLRNITISRGQIQLPLAVARVEDTAPAQRMQCHQSHANG